MGWCRVIVVAIVSVLCGHALAKTAWIGDGDLALAPAGFRDFCERSPAMCDLVGGDGDAVALPDLVWIGLEKFNHKFNSWINYQSDASTFGRSDYWTVAEMAGDCEDIALAKRNALIAAGWPAAALWLAIGRDATGDAHVVLIVRSDRGDVVLDNRDDALRLWYQVDLEWLARQTPGDRRYWRLVVAGL
jgi:predicted transglutaminase-like cysteine proteinase